MDKLFFVSLERHDSFGILDDAKIEILKSQGIKFKFIQEIDMSCQSSGWTGNNITGIGSEFITFYYRGWKPSKTFYMGQTPSFKLLLTHNLFILFDKEEKFSYFKDLSEEEKVFVEKELSSQFLPEALEGIFGSKRENSMGVWTIGQNVDFLHPDSHDGKYLKSIGRRVPVKIRYAH